MNKENPLINKLELEILNLMIEQNAYTIKTYEARLLNTTNTNDYYAGMIDVYNKYIKHLNEVIALKRQELNKYKTQPS